MESTRKKELIGAYKQRKVMGCVYEIRCAGSGKCLVRQDGDAQRAGNRLEFAQKTGTCFLSALSGDWTKYGPDSFSFRILETLEKKESQTDREFAQDLQTLAELLRDNYPTETLY